MSEICVFAGTTEGRRLVELLAGQAVDVYACVATEYGGAIMPERENIRVSAGRMDGGAMCALFKARGFDAVIDATHPFATEVSREIAEACRETGIEYLRLNRDCGAADADAVIVGSIQAAADFLAEQSGTALLTTGSKELKPYTGVEDYRQRFYVRVLPVPASLEACEAAGFPPSHIIAMQGPFSVDMNAATLRAVGAEWLVTKASGQSGGFWEKIEAARLAGVRCVVIGRPEQQSGLDYAGMVGWLCERYGLRLAREICVVGIGMGARDALTFEADRALREAECFIGAKRALEAVGRYGRPGYAETDPTRIIACMDAHPEYRHFAVLMSGDPGFYSGAKRLLPRLTGERVRVIPGLSTLQTLCARVQTPWDDAHAISLHGREGSVVSELRKWGKVFVLTDGADAVKRICSDLCAAGMAGARVTVGERLSYPDETITEGTAGTLIDHVCAPLSAVLLTFPSRAGCLPVGLPDDAFIRSDDADGMRLVPMTKSEVRAVSVSKLRLTEDAVAYDIGAGTGSVSVEMALNCPGGRVYAVERREDAAALIAQNGRRFALDNLDVVIGKTPEALDSLPAPTHAFIGGTGGDMDGIVAALLKKNPRVRIVINAVTLESAGEIAGLINKYGFDESEVVQLSVARGRRTGGYHLMTGANPVIIAAMQRREGDAANED